MTSPSKRTVSDKLAAQGLRKIVKLLESEYEKCCPHVRASSKWFDHLDRVELALIDKLSQRPISKAEISMAVDRAFKALRKTLIEESKQQPEFQECVNITTGEVKLIPKMS